ncbi:MAG: hypothetical protein IKB33_06945 [Spirochaetaceae bacterium]|nr:hypothetical protein [Spirochaetaceae bacterium]
MKRFFVLMTSVLMVLCLTSCFEFVQSISLEGESYHIKRQISFPKYFLAMIFAAEESSEETFSLEDFELQFDRLAESMQGESFHTPSESGIISTIIINKDTQNEEELASLPRKDGTKFIIPLIDMTETAEKAQTDWDSLMAAYILLSTAEYQLTLGKEIVPHISYAYLIEQNSNEQYLVDVADDGKNYLIEIPVMPLFEHPDTISSLIVEIDLNKTNPMEQAHHEDQPIGLLGNESEEPAADNFAHPITATARIHSGEGKTGNGPFGLEQGMTYEEIISMGSSVQLSHIDDDRYWIVPPKRHPSFEQYIIWLGQNEGLYCIKATSAIIKSSDYGTELKQSFHDVLLPLEKKYGKFKMIDTIAPDFILSDDQYWMSALRDGARTYQARWKAPDNNPKYNGIEEIWLGIEAKNTYSKEGYIWIEYKFSNADKAQESFDDIL